MENDISLRGNVKYQNQYPRDLQYDVSVEILGNVYYDEAHGYIWTVVMRRYEQVNLY